MQNEGSRFTDATPEQHEDKYRDLIEFAVDAFFHGDESGNIILVNQAAEELTGYSRAELLQMHLTDLLDKESLKRKPLRYDLLEQGLVIKNERNIVRKNGEIIPIEMHSKKMPDGTYQSFIRNISDRKQSETHLVLFKEALDSATDAVGMSTPEGRHYYQNTAFTQLFGEIGEYPPDTLYVDKTIGETVFHAIMRGDDWSGEVEMYAKDKSILKILLRAYAGKDSYGNVTVLIGIHTDITRQKQIENAIKESENRFNAMLSVVPDMISVHDREMNIVYSNWNGFAQIENDKRVFNTKCYHTYRGLNDICPDCEAKKVFETREPFTIEAQVTDGRWFDIRVIPVLYEAGEVSLFMEWVRDITELKKAQQELEEKTLELERFFSLALDLLCIADTDGNFIRLNKQWEQVLGYSIEELESRKFLEFIHPDDIQTTLEATQTLYAQNQVHNFVNRYRRQDGSYRWLEWHSHPFGNLIYAAARDITERKQTDETLQMERSQLLSIFNSIEEVIYVSDVNTYEILFANQAMKKAFQSELIGNLCYKEFQGLDSPCPFCTNSIILQQKPEPYYWEYHNPKVKRDFAITDRIIKWSDGSEVRFEIAIDITERKMAEKELVHAKERAEESDRLKTAFLANLSHEIRTPMNAIMGFTELLKDDTLSLDKRFHYISMVHKSGKRLLSIINDIIEISKIEAGQMKPQYSPVMINNVLNDLFHENKIIIPLEKDVQLRILESDYLHPVITDEVKLKQILSNLITNAIKFTEQGSVTFGCERVDFKENHIEFVVQDTGIGIDKKHHHAIFERFRQGDKDLAISKGGSGLGLAICKAYIDMLGGSINVESEKGKGALFRFRIPLRTEENRQVSSPLQENAFTGPGKHDENILIAEDDDDNFFLIQEILQTKRYNVIRAVNGKEAVELCLKNDNIHLVLMDIQMPVMDGYEALAEIRKEKPELVIIAQTAFVLPEDRDKIRQAGFNGCLSKPLDVGELNRIIRSSSV